MKKLFYVLLIAATTLLSVTSCTEENIAPTKDANSPGGGGTTANDIQKG